MRTVSDIDSEGTWGSRIVPCVVHELCTRDYYFSPCEEISMRMLKEFRLCLYCLVKVNIVESSNDIVYKWEGRRIVT